MAQPLAPRRGGEFPMGLNFREGSRRKLAWAEGKWGKPSDGNRKMGRCGITMVNHWIGIAYFWTDPHVN